MNLEDRLRQAIDRQTDAPPAESLPPGLRQRARRRIAATVATALIAVSVLGSGAVLLVRSQAPDRLPPADESPTVPPPTPPAESAPERFVNEFMAARLAGSGAEAFLSDAAREQYEDPFRTPALYGDESREVRFGEHTVWLGNTDGTGETVAYLRTRILYPGDSAPCPATEVLVIDPRGSSGDSAPSFVVRSASVLERGWTQGSFDHLAAEELVCAFVTARLGHTDEHPATYLSANAAEQYERGDGGLRLMAPTPSHWGFWWIIRSTESGDTVHVVLTLNNTGQPDPIYEELVMGSAEGERVVLSAAIIPCEEAQGSAEYCG